MDLRNVGRALVWTVATGPDPAPTLLPRRLSRWGRGVRPVVFTLAFVMAVGGLADNQGGNPAVIVAAVVPLVVLVFRPLLAWRIAWVVGLIGLRYQTTEVSWPWHPVQVLVFLIVLFVVATCQPPSVLYWIWAFSIGLAWPYTEPGARVGVLVFFTALLVVGDQVRRRQRAQRALADQEEQSAVLAERARIARELHDVVAHHMSLIAVRAETAPYRLGVLSDPVRVEFAEVSRQAREALVEMRRLLGVLRGADDGPATAPQPGLDELPALVAAAGIAAPVQLDLPDELVDLPSGVGLSAYRIVQEALSNAARHAPGAPVTVTLSRSGAALRLVVHNGPSERPPVRDAVPGHGLRGMRERTAMLGGTLSAGPTGDGGYEVRAELPG